MTSSRDPNPTFLVGFSHLSRLSFRYQDVVALTRV